MSFKKDTEIEYEDGTVISVGYASRRKKEGELVWSGICGLEQTYEFDTVELDKSRSTNRIKRIVFKQNGSESGSIEGGKEDHAELISWLKSKGFVSKNPY